MIVISHDRFFLDSIADHLFVFEGDGKVRDFPGNYTEYRQWRDAREKEARTVQNPRRNSSPAADADGSAQTARVSRGGIERAPKLTFKERKELEALTEEIDRLTEEKQELERLFNSGEVVADIDSKSRRYTELASLLDDKEMRWLELSEKA